MYFSSYSNKKIAVFVRMCMIKEEEVYVCEMTYFDSVYCSSQTNKSAVERKKSLCARRR